MKDEKIEVVKSIDLMPGASTTGIVRDRAFETERVLFARSRIAAGTTSGWHNHGTRDLFGYLLKGRLRFEYGKNGEHSVELGPGDYFHISIGTIHRDVNPSAEEEAIVVNLLVGEGPAVVNVPHPE